MQPRHTEEEGLLPAAGAHSPPSGASLLVLLGLCAAAGCAAAVASFAMEGATVRADGARGRTLLHGANAPPPAACPFLFPFDGEDPSGVWSAEDGKLRNVGACNGNTRFPAPLRHAAFCFDGRGGVDVDLARVDTALSAEGCMSFGARCAFQKRSLRSLQFAASTSGCFGAQSVWAAPLWMAPDHWVAPQGRSGEIDFMERCGNQQGTGIALNFGAPAAAGARSSYAIDDTDREHVYYFEFQSPWSGEKVGDAVEAYQCAEGTMPSLQGIAAAQCKLLGTYPNYFSWTDKPGDLAANTFRLVTDIWNVPEAVASGGACVARAPFANRACRYRVSGILFRFSDSTWATNPACSRLLVPSERRLRAKSRRGSLRNRSAA